MRLASLVVAFTGRCRRPALARGLGMRLASLVFALGGRTRGPALVGVALPLVVALTGCVVRPGALLVPAPIGIVAAGGAVAAPGGHASVSVHVSFFGVPLDGAQDVVFVLDRSGSMSGVTAGVAGSSVGMSKGGAFAAELGATLVNGATGNHLPTKLAAAKAELIHTLRAMPDGTRFNVIWFDDEIAVTARRMLVLEPGSRAAIEHFIAGIEPGGSTAAVPALELAYRMGAARVVLLSDGLANTGGGGDELLARARSEMQRGVRFDTVGLGIDQDGELLQRLAAESGGVAMMR